MGTCILSPFGRRVPTMWLCKHIYVPTTHTNRHTNTLLPPTPKITSLSASFHPPLAGYLLLLLQSTITFLHSLLLCFNSKFAWKYHHTSTHKHMPHNAQPWPVRTVTGQTVRSLEVKAVCSISRAVARKKKKHWVQVPHKFSVNDAKATALNIFLRLSAVLS